MTFSNRRRLIHLLWAFASNWALPFMLGWVFSLITITHSFVESLYAVDKSGLAVCVVKDSK